MPSSTTFRTRTTRFADKRLGETAAMQPKMLDHVAFWVSDRRPIARFLTRHVGLRVIDEQEAFTLLGADARRFKITLFDAVGPREPGPFMHLALRVNDLAEARAALPARTPEVFDAGEGLRLTFVQADTDLDGDLDHVALLSRDPVATAADYERYGFRHTGGNRAELAGAFVELHPGSPPRSERPLLNHLAVLVDSADDHIADAEELGIDVESVVDAANTYAAFLSGPEGVRIEYVEHKPTFSLT
jgi:catechol 2,3-dioxygenase-like lactoylglutathione lyase family enzyme